MNATSGTMQLPGATRHTGPLREAGASALDRRRATWAAPDPATIVLDPWRPPQAGNRISSSTISPWPAPLAQHRVGTPVSQAVPMAMIEPLHAVRVPDVAALARQQARARLVTTRRLHDAIELATEVVTPMAPLDVHRPGLPRPTPDQLVLSDEQARALTSQPALDRSGISGRLLAAVVIGVGIWFAAATVVFTIF
jgi:hypothetical protein